ncbi:hypothetical protein ACFL2J_04210 [Candidatus Omnitrophota bacterium]
MNIRVSFVLAIILGLIVFGASCLEGDEVSLVSVSDEVAQPKSSAEEIIEEAKEFSTTAEKVSFLLGEAGAFYDGFYNSEKFQNTIDIAQHILQYLDADSQQAKDLIKEAKEALVSTANAPSE